MFFQNPFGEEFRQSWPIDQQARFSIQANLNNVGADMASGKADPYDFSAVNTLTINIAYDPLRVGYTAINVNVAGVNPAATSAVEVVNKLNSNPLFADNFTAIVRNFFKGGTAHGGPFGVLITSKRPRQAVRFYVTNAGAEQKLQFNYQAHVAQFPSYFDRYTVANRFVFPDGPSTLVKLDPSNPVDAAVITAAGLDPTMPLADYQLLDGRSNTHTFSKITVDGSGRITEIIEYFAGAQVGDLARKIQYVYSGAGTTPSQITTVPYTLTSGDLVTPP
jgi:hypothetical protein